MKKFQNFREGFDKFCPKIFYEEHCDFFITYSTLKLVKKGQRKKRHFAKLNIKFLSLKLKILHSSFRERLTTKPWIRNVTHSYWQIWVKNLRYLSFELDRLLIDSDF